MWKGKSDQTRAKGTRVIPFARVWSFFGQFFLPTWTIGAEKSPGENIIANGEYLDNLPSQWHANI